MPSAIVRIRVIICFLFLIPLNPILTPGAGAQPVSVGPVLRSALTIQPSFGLVAVQGEGFTPGGLVTIVLYDRWGQDAFVPVRTVASLGQYGANGSADPAQGYVAAGTIDRTVDFLPDASYGPNGSADPAQGYVPGATAEIVASLQCGQLLMVRAHDARSNAWTNLVDIAVAC